MKATLINNETSTIFGIVVLIVSIFNTFFRPHQQLTDNLDAMNKWQVLGTEFEELYYNEITTNDELYEKKKKYEELKHKIHCLQIEINSKGQKVYK